MGTQVVGESNSVEYSTPLKIVQPLINEFGLTKDVCASALNHKLPDYWTKEDILTYTNIQFKTKNK